MAALRATSAILTDSGDDEQDGPDQDHERQSERDDSDDDEEQWHGFLLEILP